MPEKGSCCLSSCCKIASILVWGATLHHSVPHPHCLSVKTSFFSAYCITTVKTFISGQYLDKQQETRLGLHQIPKWYRMIVPESISTVASAWPLNHLSMTPSTQSVCF